MDENQKMTIHEKITLFVIVFMLFVSIYLIFFA